MTSQFQPGDILSNRFKVIRFIAAGGMGEVYEVEDRQLQGVRLALKTILPHIAAAPHMQDRFEREVLLARHVVHPNLCPIYDIFHCRHQDADLTFLTMKLLPGETLAARLQRDGPIPLTEADPIVSQVAAALSAAHNAGVLHRDIKTANIMLAGKGSGVYACVTDFGLARAYESDSTILTVEGVAGTPGYAAPELFHGVAPSKASDVYAFGVVVYKMLSGHSPPFRLDPKERRTRDSFTDQLPAAWKRLIEGCLEPSVSARFQSLPEAVAALHGDTRAKPHVAGTAGMLSRRRVMLLGAGAMAGAGAAVWLNWTRIDFALHPLPAKRFVALTGWPTPSDASLEPTITAVVDAMGSELTRAEAYDHNLLIIPKRVGKDVASMAQLNEFGASLGTNLVLSASALPGSKEIHLLLRVLDPAASKTLRQHTISVAMDDQLSLPEKAVRVAAELLEIAHYETDEQRNKIGTTNREAYAVFQEAEALKQQDNDTGLDAAIEKYKKAIELDPQYAIAQAKLAWAYLRSYGLHNDAAALALAGANAKSAIQFAPTLVDAHLALFSFYQQTGEMDNANKEMTKALSLDPTDPHTLIYQARFYAANNRWDDADATFARVIAVRPNHYLAHHERGVILDEQGKYHEALTEFRTASLAYPADALARTNVGSVYYQLGKLPEALDNLNASFKMQQRDYTAVALAQALRAQQKFQDAIGYAQMAVKMKPNGAANWLELGDSYSASGKSHAEADDAYKRAAAALEEQLNTSPKNGPGWMILALCRVKSGQPETASALIEKAEALFADDMDSQLCKVRTLELLGKRDDALAAIARCLSRGPTLFQFQTMLDLEGLRKSREYQKIANAADNGSASAL